MDHAAARPGNAQSVSGMSIAEGKQPAGPGSVMNGKFSCPMCCRFELLGTLILFFQALSARRAQKRAARLDRAARRPPKANTLQH
ncbi:hypothetical protein N0V88_005117 [Collariella sp. IMI 366227]|nr:hypothetical protein N0V88_005117 [Collariella sp. IMI 366227]